MDARKKRQDGVETREAILAAAAEEFAEKGFELASAREICRRARANSALMNRYFGSKEDLYRTVAKSLFGELGASQPADTQWRKSESLSHIAIIDGATWLTQTNIVSCSDSAIAPLVSSSSRQLTDLTAALPAPSRSIDIRGNITDDETFVD